MTKRKNTSSTDSQPQRYSIDLREAAHIIKMSYHTIRDWGLAGKIATHKFGACVKISNIKLDRVIAEAERPRVARHARGPV